VGEQTTGEVEALLAFDSDSSTLESDIAQVAILGRAFTMAESLAHHDVLDQTSRSHVAFAEIDMGKFCAAGSRSVPWLFTTTSCAT
jgi:hypothetical protein